MSSCMFGARKGICVVALGMASQVPDFKKRVARPNGDFWVQIVCQVNNPPSGQSHLRYAPTQEPSDSETENEPKFRQSHPAHPFPRMS